MSPILIGHSRTQIRLREISISYKNFLYRIYQQVELLDLGDGILYNEVLDIFPSATIRDIVHNFSSSNSPLKRL